MTAGNLFVGLPATPPADERFDVLVERAGWKVERIVSWGHATAPGDWFDQATDEWVVLLVGRARLQIEGEAAPRELGPGDWVLLPARVRHRVAWTAEGAPTVWLAVHSTATGPSPAPR
ncbi:MAG TPA: cupin domain-containing protein [Gemmata sp.]